MSPAKIVVITTGGTVAARTTADGAIPALSAADLLPGSSSDIEIVPVDLMSIDSAAMTVGDQLQIVGAIADALSDTSVTGVVVTHGTDTMEETAYLSDLFIADDRPVVFTGAQYPADAHDADGPDNIAAAMVVAADAAQRGRGTLLALGGDVRVARGAFKVSTTDRVAFDSVHDSLPRVTLTAPVPTRPTVRVDSFGLYPGVSAGIIAAAVAQRASGIVLAATGSGNTHPDITAEVAGATRSGVAVVVTTRVPYGEVLPTYGGGGGAVDLERAGAIVSHWLRAPQARIAVLALLSTGADTEAIAAFFAAAEPA